MTVRSVLDTWLPLVILSALPVFGLFSGPAYGPLILGLGVIWMADCLRGDRQVVRPPWALAVLAVGLLVLGAVSILWSVDPVLSRHAVLQMGLVSVGGLCFLSTQSRLSDRALDRLVMWFPAMAVLGAVWLAVDTGLDYRLSHALGRGITASSKYNRGVNYLLIILWPVLFLCWMHGRRLWAAALLAAALVILLLGKSTTAYLQMVAAVVALLAGWALPRLISYGLAAGTSLLVTVLPFAIAALSPQRRQAIMGQIKSSAGHRLEIWDYMASHVMQHPLIGWGFGAAKALLPTEQQLATYRWADANGIYPHNQWMELWVGLGGLGVCLGLGFIWLAARGMTRLPMGQRPFAAAAFASALCLCLTSYELTTDSWWAALAVCAALIQWGRRTQA